MVKRKSTFYQYVLILVFSFMLLSSWQANAQSPLIVWTSGYPNSEPVNVGSSKVSYIYFRFEVQDAAIPGAKIKVQLPAQVADSYDPAIPAINKGGGAFIDYTGNITWNPTDRTITFSGKDLAVGNNVFYAIPHKATDALPQAITSGSGSISVLASDDTPIDSKNISYNYNRAQLPIVPATGKSDLTLNFGTDNGSHNPGTNSALTYKFGLSTAGGSIDSCRVKVAFPKAAATLVPGTWTCKGLPVSRVDEVVGTNDVTYTLYLDKSFSQGADGFDAGEKVDITFDVKKTYCGNTTLSISAAWGSSGDYVASTATTGSFAATPSTGDPILTRVSFGPVNGGMRYTDGVTPNTFRTIIKNTGSGDACDIVYSLSTSSSPYTSFLSTTGIRYSVDGGTTWDTPTVTSGGNRNGGSNPYLVKAAYQSKPTSLTIRMSKNLPAGQNLIVEWNGYTAPDMFSNSTAVDRNWTRSVRHDDSWTYTDLCRSSPANVQSIMTYGLAEYATGTNLGATINLSPSTTQQEGKLLSVIFGAYASNGTLLCNATSFYQMKVVLPKGIKIAKSGANYLVRLDDNGTAWAYTNPTESLGGTQNVYTFDFTQRSTATKNLYITFESDGTGTNGLYNADISFDFLPTGTEGGTPPTYNVRMPGVLQFYSPISLVTAQAGIKYDLNIERVSVGLQDVGNTGKPDSPLKRIDATYLQTNQIDHKQMVAGDTVMLKYEGEMVQAGMKNLYAIMYSQGNQNVFRILKDIVVTSGDNSYTATLINAVSNNIVQPKDLVGGVAPKNYAYVWKITRNDNQNFAIGEHVNINIPFLAVDNGSNYQPTNYKVGSWFYATTADVSDPYNPGTAAKGDEEYGYTTTYYRGTFGGWANSPTTLNFTGAQEIQASSYANPIYTTFSNYTPNEFRNLATADTVFVTVPDGYLINDQLEFTITGASGALFVNADPANSTKTRKAFPIIDKYDTNASTIYRQDAAGSIRIVEGTFALTAKPKIKATPRTAVGTQKMLMNIKIDNHTYTQSLVPNADLSAGSGREYASTSLVYADGPGIFISTTDPATKNLANKRMSWNFKLSSTLTSPASQVWLYVQGPVENVTFNGVSGTGEGKRWIKLPSSIPANSNIDDNLSFDVIPDKGCSNQKITVYPIYNPTAPANWSPFGAQTDAAFSQDNSDFDNYVYRELIWTLTPVASQIAGSFTSWSASLSDPSNLSSPAYAIDSVEVGQPFTVEVKFDASTSAGPVAELEATLNFPKGLEYIANSAYIEYNSVNTAITDADWTGTSGLGQLTEASSDNPTSMTLKLKDIVDQISIANMFGTSATIDGGTSAMLRFQMKPTCQIDMDAEQITALFAGKRYCNLSTDANGSNIQTFPSTKLTLKNALLPFRSTLNLTPQLDSLICEPGYDTADMTISFKKISKLGDDMSQADSIRITLPASLNLIEKISYNYPAYTGYGLNIPAEADTMAIGDLTTYVDGDLRYFSWQLPQAYYSQLATKAASDQVILTYDFKVKAGSRKLGAVDSTRIYISSLSERAPHPSCPRTTVEPDSVFNEVVLIPSRNALLQSMSVNNQSVVNFESNKFEYNVILPCGTTTIDIFGNPVSECADVSFIYQELLEKQFKRFEITVTAEAGNQQVYVVNARPLLPAKILEDLSDELVACEYVDYTMHIVAEGDSLQYQWFYEGDSIPNSDNDTLLITNPLPETDYGMFKVSVRGACQSHENSSESRLWVASPLPLPIVIENMPNRVFTGQLYSAHIGVEYGYNDITNYRWEFYENDSTSVLLSEGRDKQTIHTTFSEFHGKNNGTLRVSLEHPCAAHYGPYVTGQALEIENLTNIDGNEIDQVKLYPNPFGDELHINVNNDIQSIVITDISGRKVAVYTNNIDTYTTIKTSSWAKGTYLVTIKTAAGTATYKVVKK